MARAVILPMAIIVFVLFVISCHNFSIKDRKSRSLRSLNRRLGLDAKSMPTFDPLVAKMETKEINKDEEDAYVDHGRLKISLRLMVLFPLLDKAPKDNFVDPKELEEWIVLQTVDRLHARAKREMELRDLDRDDAISFEEFLPQYANQHIDTTDKTHGGAGWWMEQFKNADFDNNGSLDLFEFCDFLYPQNSNSQNIQRWLLREKISQLDLDNDGKLSLKEFEDGAFKSYKTYFEFENGVQESKTPLDLFNNLDVIDEDGFLGVEELMPILRYLDPGEKTYAKFYSNFLLNEADDDKDGKLTIDEMLNHEHIFYNTVYDAEKDTDDYDDIFHDEL